MERINDFWSLVTILPLYESYLTSLSFSFPAVNSASAQLPHKFIQILVPGTCEYSTIFL